MDVVIAGAFVVVELLVVTAYAARVVVASVTLDSVAVPVVIIGVVLAKDDDVGLSSSFPPSTVAAVVVRMSVVRLLGYSRDGVGVLDVGLVL